MKRIISLLLVFTMMVGILPTQVFAEEFFSEESFGAASHHDETFFEDEDFSAFFSDEEDLGSLFEEPEKAEDRATDDSDSAVSVEESFAAEVPTEQEFALEESFSQDLFATGTEFLEEPEAVPAEDLELYEVASDETDEETTYMIPTEEAAEAPEATEVAEVATEGETAGTESESGQTTAEASEADQESAGEKRDVELEIEAEDLVARAAISTLRVVPGASYYSGGTTMHIKLKWELYTGATAYRVRYSTTEGSLTSSSCPYQDFTTTEYNEDDLKTYGVAELNIPFNAVLHYFAVLPLVGSALPEGISNVVEWMPTPATPADFIARPKAGEAGTIQFSWKDLSGKGITGYLLYEGDKDKGTLKTPTPISKYATSTELTGYTQVGRGYTFTLYTYIDGPDSKDGKYDPAKDLISIGVPFYYVVPPTAPIINKAINVTTTSVELQWTTVTGVSGYRVYYYELGESITDYDTWPKYKDVEKASSASTVLNNLTALHYYKFVIRSYVTKSGSPIYDEDGEQIGTETIRVYSDTSDPYPYNATEWFRCLPGVVVGTEAGYNTVSKTINVKWTNQGDPKVDGYDPNVDGYAIYYVIDDLTTFTQALATRVPSMGYIDKSLNVYEILSPTLGSQYYFKIVASFGGNEGVFDDAVIFPKPPVEVIPGQVTELKAESAGYNGSSCSIILTWKEITGVKGYKIQRSTKPYATASASDITTFTVTPDTTTTYTDTGLKLGQNYYYRVLAYVDHTSGSGTAEGAWSDVIVAMGSPSDPTSATIDPYITTADLAVQDCALKVKWAKVTDGVDGYKVTLMDAFTGAVVESDVKIAGSDSTSHIFKNLKAGEPYYAIVKSYIGNAVSPGRETSNKLTPALWVPQKTSPYNFTIDPVDATSVKVIWPAIKGVSGYYVNVKANTVAPIDGSFHNIVDQKVTKNEYTIKGLKTGYKYIVTVASYTEAQNTTIRSDYPTTWIYSPPEPAGYETNVYDENGNPTVIAADHSEIVQARPNQVTGLKLKIEYDGDGKPYAQLTWKKVPGLDEAIGGGGYLVYRNGTLLETLKGEDVNAYKDDLSSFTPGQKLTYYICAYVDIMNTANLADYGIGKPSSEVSDVVGIQALKPEIDHDPNGFIRIKWEVPDWLKSFTNIKFYIHRAKGSTSFSKAVAVTAISPVSYNSSGKYDVTDTTLTVPDGKKYYYWIVPADMSTPENQFARSSYAMGMVSGPRVTSLTVKDIEARRVTLEWPAVAGVKGYVIYTSMDGGTSWKKVKTVGKSKTSYTLKKLAYHQDYTFAVSAKYKGGATSAKTMNTGTTRFSAVVQTDMIITNGTKSKLAWEKVPDATGYCVELYDGTQWKGPYTTKNNKITIKDLEIGKQYNYYVYPYITWQKKTYPEAKASTWSSWDPEYKNSTYTGTAKVYVAPKAPSSLKVKKVGAGLANFTWKEVTFSGGTVQYRIEYSTDEVTWTKLVDKLSGDTQYSMGSPLASGTYFFRVTPYYEADGKTYFGTPRKKKATL